MGFSPRIYEVHLWMKDEHGDWWWEPEGGGYESYDQALTWYNRFKDGGYDGVRIVETKVVRAWEWGKEYK